MSLRRRVVLAVATLIVLIVAAGGTVLGLHRSFLLDRLDAELIALSENPRALVALAERTDAAGGELSGVFADVYIGRIGPNGRLVTVIAPTQDPTLVPAVSPEETIQAPSTRATRTGQARRVRVMTAPLRSGGTAVLAISTTSVDQATRRLALTLGLAGLAVVIGLAFLLRWVDQLGLRPIAEMTSAADAIASGDTHRRIPAGKPGTEAARLGSALTTMIEATQASEDRLRRFVADASHELRTPLTSIQGYAELHLAASPDAEPIPAGVTDALGRIQAESARMRRIVDSLLDLATLDESGIEQRGPVDLKRIVEDVASDLRVIAPDREITTHTPEQPTTIQGDRDRLVQALMALGANALRHTPKGCAVSLTVRPTEELVLLEVADAGPGISAEHLPHLFERFYRVDAGRSSGRGGSGLGLAIVDAIARGHGGAVSVRSAPGVGSAFTIAVPRDGGASRSRASH